MDPGSRTPVRKPTLEALSALNDQLCYFQFVKEEFRKTRDRFGNGAQDLYTTDLFSDNPFAQRIHVKLAALGDFEQKTRGVGLGAFVSASYEVASTYYDGALELLKDVLGSAFIPDGSSQPEEAFDATLAKSGLGSVGRDLVNTLKYLRLRRNHFVHLATGPSKGFTELAMQHGANLNAEWKGGGLDFADPRLGGFSNEEAVDALRVMRICVERLDSHVGGRLSPRLVSEMLASKMDVPRRLNSDVRHVLAKRLASDVEYGFGIGMASHEALEIVRRQVG